MFILGLVLLLLGWLLNAPILENIGIIALVLGVILWLIGMFGSGIGGRRFWY